MAAILKNGCHFFPAEYRQGSPPRSCAGRSPEHVDTQHVFTTAHVRWTPKTGFCSLRRFNTLELNVCICVCNNTYVKHYTCDAMILPMLL